MDPSTLYAVPQFCTTTTAKTNVEMCNLNKVEPGNTNDPENYEKMSDLDKIGDCEKKGDLDNDAVYEQMCYNTGLRRTGTIPRGDPYDKHTSSKKFRLISVAVVVVLVVSVIFVFLVAAAAFALGGIAFRNSVGILKANNNSLEIESLKVELTNGEIMKLWEKINNIRYPVQKVNYTDIINDIKAFHVFESCVAISALSLPFPAGLYLIRKFGGTFTRQYCDPSRPNSSCKGISGPWRIVEHFASNSTAYRGCPNGLVAAGNNSRFCKRPQAEKGCTSVFYQSDGLGYSQVCGNINAYRVGSPDGFSPIDRDGMQGIEDVYVDGVVLTYGSPRNHIWTFAATMNSCNECGVGKPNFIGSDFTCSSTANCGGGEPCLFWSGPQCTGNDTFYKNLSGVINEDIELRVCRDQIVGDEDFLLQLIKIYVL